MRSSALVPLLFSFAVGCRHHTPPTVAPLPPFSSSTTRATLDRRELFDELPGSVRAKHTATIAPTLSGTVVAVRFAMGSRVRKGEVLVHISAPEIDAKLAQAHASYEHAKQDQGRAERLQSSNAIAAAQYEALSSQLQVAAAARDEADSVAAHTTLRAPFSGIVTAKSVSVGDTVMPGQPLLTLEEPGALRLEASVPQETAQRFGLGQTLGARIDGVAAPIGATIAEIAPTADPASRTVLVKLDLPPAFRARSGLFARLLVPVLGSHSVVVPSAAIERHGQLESVYVLQEDRARRRLVRTGEERDGLTQISSGLAADEVVLVLAGSAPRDGQPVRRTP